MLATQPHFFILFDESLNKASKWTCIVNFGKQMVKISTRYYTSAFIGHAKADDMLQHFEDYIEELNINKLTQISMDGPNVNWMFYKDYCAKFADVSGKSLLMI